MKRKMKALIIDDDKTAIALLEKRIRQGASEACVEIVAKTQTDVEGRIAIIQYQPDLIFLDIDLSATVKGYDLAAEFVAFDCIFAIVFVTGHPEHELKARKSLGRTMRHDYLLKPPTVEELDTVIIDIYRQWKERDQSTTVQAQKAPPRDSGDLEVVHSNFGKIKIPMANIRYLTISQSNNDYVEVHFMMTKTQRGPHGKPQDEGTPLMVEETARIAKPMSKLITELPSPPFVQVHQSHIVNMNYIDKYDQVTKWIIIGKQKLEVSRAKRQHFEMQWLSHNYEV